MNTKKVNLFLIISAALVVIFSAAFFVLSYFYRNTPIPNAPKTDIRIYSGSLTVISDGEYNQIGNKKSLTFQNVSEKDLTFAVMFDKDTSFDGASLKAYEMKKLSIPAGEKAKIPFECDADAKIALISENSANYVFDDKSFSAAQNYSDSFRNYMLFAGEYEKITVLSPLCLFGDFKAKNIEADTEKSGKIIICPENEFVSDMFFYSPECEISLFKVTPSFSADKNDIYFTAKKLNNTHLYKKSYPVSETSDLMALSLHRIKKDATVTVISPFELNENICFNCAANFEFKNKITFGDNILSVKTDEAAKMTFSTSAYTSFSLENLVIEAPNASVLWIGEDIPTFSYFSKMENVKEYQNNKTLLGGEGSGIAEITLLKSDNPSLENDVVFTKNRNTYEGTFGYLTKLSSLKNAKFSVKSPYGAYFENANPDGTVDLSKDAVIAVKDENGKESKCIIGIKREELDIPVIYLSTENGVEITSKKVYTDGELSLSYGGLYEDIDPCHIRIRGRGNSTWKWDKKPYKIHFDKPVSLFGLPEAEEWALLANYADKSLMRNRVALEMAKELSFDYVPSQYCVDVFMNGDYIGLYSIGEHLEAGEGRVEIKSNPNKNDCGFFLEVGGVETGVDVKGMNYFHAGLVKFVLIKSPDYKKMTTSQFNYIKDYVTKVNDTIVKGEDYYEYIDVDSLVDWLIMTELTNNTDCSFRRSTFFIKNAGEKLKMATVWDFDLALGNFSHDAKNYDSWASSTPDDDYVGTTWSTYLLEDEYFRQKFKARYNEVKDRLVDRAMEVIEETYNNNKRSADMNFKVWDILGRKVAFERKDNSFYDTYEDQIVYLKSFIKSRAAWISSQVEKW